VLFGVCSLTCKFLSALNDRSSDVRETDRKARRRTLGRPQPGGCRNSDDGCPRTASMASKRSYSSLVPSRRNAKIIVFIMACACRAAAFALLAPHAKFAIRSIVVRRTINEQAPRIVYFTRYASFGRLDAQWPRRAASLTRVCDPLPNHSRADRSPAWERSGPGKASA
jgi:hypothetical protein